VLLLILSPDVTVKNAILGFLSQVQPDYRNLHGTPSPYQVAAPSFDSSSSSNSSNNILLPAANQLLLLPFTLFIVPAALNSFPPHLGS
jgi:hypothetical protein